MLVPFVAGVGCGIGESAMLIAVVGPRYGVPGLRLRWWPVASVAASPLSVLQRFFVRSLEKTVFLLS